MSHAIADRAEELELVYGSHPTLGKRKRRYNRKTGSYDLLGYTGEHQETHDRCLALAVAIDSGAFNDALLAAFGDHAEIKIDAEEIHIDEYAHN